MRLSAQPQKYLYLPGIYLCMYISWLFFYVSLQVASHTEGGGREDGVRDVAGLGFSHSVRVFFFRVWVGKRQQMVIYVCVYEEHVTDLWSVLKLNVEVSKIDFWVFASFHEFFGRERAGVRFPPVNKQNNSRRKTKWRK